jgi:hypothetical protein
MNITCTIQTSPEDSFKITADEAAETILKALKGNPAKDTCTVTIHMPAEMGTHGTTPPPVLPLESPAPSGTNGEPPTPTQLPA